MLTRHMDALLRDYNAIIRKDKSRKVSISDVYENELYTPFEDWAAQMGATFTTGNFGKY